MRILRLFLIAIMAGVWTLTAAEMKPDISAASLRARTVKLASDEFEGRAPATDA